MNIEDTVFKLIKRFAFTKPVTIVKSDHQSIVVESEEIIFYIDGKTIASDMIEATACAKISENDPLISVTRFQKGFTEREGEYAKWFHSQDLSI